MKENEHRSVYTVLIKTSNWITDESDLVVVFVHGTFNANTKYDVEAAIFVSEIQTRLPSVEVDFAQFGWSGNNFYQHRISAAKSLAKYIIDASEILNRKRGLVLIGHSHGGNIAMEVARFTGSRLKCPIQVMCLGTPLMSRRSQRDIRRILQAFVTWMGTTTLILLLRDGSESLYMFRIGQLDSGGALVRLMGSVAAFLPPLLLMFGPLSLWMFLFAHDQETATNVRQWFNSGIVDESEDDPSRFYYFFDDRDEVAWLFRALNFEEAIPFVVKVCSIIWLGIFIFRYIQISAEQPTILMQEPILFATKEAFLTASNVVAFYGIVGLNLGFLMLSRILTFGNRRLGVIQDRVYSYGGANAISVSVEKSSLNKVENAVTCKPPVLLSEDPARHYIPILKLVPVVSISFGILFTGLTYIIWLVFAWPLGLYIFASIHIGGLLVFLTFLVPKQSRYYLMAFFRSLRALRNRSHTNMKGDPRVASSVAMTLQNIYETDI